MKGRVLVVAPDAQLRQTLQRHLEAKAFQSLFVEDAESALAQLAAFQPQVVLCAARMPGITGLELLQKLRDSHGAAAVPVILMESVVDLPSAVAAIKQGVFDYLVPPLDFEVIDRALARALRAHQARGGGGAVPVAEPAADELALVGTDLKIAQVYKMIGKVSKVRTPVLIRGETGTGKEVVARMIHANTTSTDGPFLPINCSALPETLLESELFGHARGAYTGAVSDRKGRFELASRGTIFLDEVGDINEAVQVKLLRVLQDGEFQPLGSERLLRTEARIIAATHQSLEQLVAEGTCREDLYYRLRVVEIVVPPLRERPGDIPALVDHVLGRMCRGMGRPVPAIPKHVMELLQNYEWPGNVRELENTMARAAVLAEGVIEPEYLSLGLTLGGGGRRREDASLDAMERWHVLRVLAKTGGRKTEAAAALGISRPRLNRLLRKYRT